MAKGDPILKQTNQYLYGYHRAIGRWYAALGDKGYSERLFTMVANRLYAVLFEVPETTTFDGIGFEVTTLAAGANARLGIYKIKEDGTMYPDALVLDAGVVSVATTGAKPIAISKQLLPGLYGLAIVSDGTPIIASFLYGTLLGTSTCIGYGAQPSSTWVVTFTYAALPDPFTAGGTVLGYDTLLLKMKPLSFP